MLDTIHSSSPSPGLSSASVSASPLNHAESSNATRTAKPPQYQISASYDSHVVQAEHRCEQCEMVFPNAMDLRAVSTTLHFTFHISHLAFPSLLINHYENSTLTVPSLTAAKNLLQTTSLLLALPPSFCSPSLTQSFLTHPILSPLGTLPCPASFSPLVSLQTVNSSKAQSPPKPSSLRTIASPRLKQKRLYQNWWRWRWRGRWKLRWKMHLLLSERM